MMILAFLTSVAAFLMMGLADPKHHEARLGRPCSAVLARRMIRVGWGLLVLAFVLSMIAWGPVFGAVCWAGGVMAAAAVVFLGLNLLPNP